MKPPSFILVPLIYLYSCVPAQGDFSDSCPSTCKCKWAHGKREADCTNGGFPGIPTILDSEVQILRMGGNYVRTLGAEVFKTAGLINLQRIYMNNCNVQVCSHRIQLIIAS